MAGLFVTNFGCIIIMLAQCSPVQTYWKGCLDLQTCRIIFCENQQRQLTELLLQDLVHVFAAF